MLVAALLALGWKFIVAGSTQKLADGRVAVMLAPAERALLLGEMRSFVAGLQTLADALAREDMKSAAAAARAMGSARSHDVPAAMMGKLPLEFKSLAMGVHGGFDTMALDAEALGLPKHTLAQLSDVLQKCVACHATYTAGTAAP
ncbi:MAG: hypothetical protein ABI886_03320 [Betaproteobacteria bacterium]